MNFQSTGLQNEEFSSTNSSMFSTGAPNPASFQRQNRKRSDSKNNTTYNIERNHFLESTDESSPTDQANRLRLTQRQLQEKIKGFALARYGKKNERMISKYNEIANKL
jgi:hypothetical protein